MRIRRCLYCLAVVGTCLHTALVGAKRPEPDEPPARTPFVISAPTASASTTSAVARDRVLFLSTG